MLASKPLGTEGTLMCDWHFGNRLYHKPIAKAPSNYVPVTWYCVQNAIIAGTLCLFIDTFQVKITGSALVVQAQVLEARSVLEGGTYLMFWYSIDDLRDFMLTAGRRRVEPSPPLPNAAIKGKTQMTAQSNDLYVTQRHAPKAVFFSISNDVVEVSKNPWVPLRKISSYNCNYNESPCVTSQKSDL